MKLLIHQNKGSVLMITTVLFVMISLSVALGLVAPVLRAGKLAETTLASKQSYFAAESGVEDVLYRIRNAKQVSSSETLIVGDAQALTTITDNGSGQKNIVATGDSDNRNRIVSASVVESEGVSFNYGVQVGVGGISLSGSSGINGSVYANGNITGTSSTYITGSAIAANSDPLSTDQANGDTGTPPATIIFGNANVTQDLAQSFQVSSESPLNKVQLYLRKNGTPSNVTVYVMTDNNGSPSAVHLASATLSASLVTNAYGWVDAVFSTNPTLQTGVTYWLVVDAGTSSSNYYTSAANSNVYNNGNGKIGQRGGTWNNTTPTGLDAYFRLYIGGQTSSISGENQWNQLRVGTSGSGIARASVVNNTNATGIIYCQSGTGNNKACNTTQQPPAPQAWPVSDNNIADFKDQALVGGTQTGNVSYGGSTTASIGPRKIVGNLDIGGSAVVTTNGTLWVTGNLTIGGSGRLKLSSAYGSNSGVIIVDGRISIAGSSPVEGSGTSGSYILLISLSDCPTSSSCSGSNAINISGSAGAVVLVAQNGTISFSGSARAKQATAYRLSLSGSTTVTYESGLADITFSSGPSGSWAVTSWKETQ